MPLMRRFRYVARVPSPGRSGGLIGVLGVAMTDPDTAAEAAARTGHEESPRDDRP
jgi:hypothetical protein